MKKMFFFSVLFLILTLSNNAQDSKHIKSSPKNCPVKVLITPQDKNICLLSLNKQLYLATMNDIQWIDSKYVSTIQMYLPETEQYKLLLSKSEVKDVEVMCVFEITTVKDAKLPEKFIIQK